MNWLNKSSQIEQYVAEVRSYLPRKTRDDIAQELRVNLEERFSDQAEELGRPLSKDEAIALLNRNGHPIRVAANYHGATHGVVSAELFPFYKRAIFSAFLVSVIGLLVAIGLEVIYDITVGSSSWLWLFINTFMYIVGCITAVFYIIEWQIRRKNWLANWKPAKKITVDKRSVSVWTEVFTVVALITWLAILNLVPVDTSRAVFLGESGNPVLTLLLWIKASLLLLIALHSVLIFTQKWSMGSKLFQAGADLVVVAGCVFSLLIDRSMHSVYAELPDTFLNMIVVSIWVFLIISLLSAAYYIWQAFSYRKAYQ